MFGQILPRHTSQSSVIRRAVYTTMDFPPPEYTLQETRIQTALFIVVNLTTRCHLQLLSSPSSTKPSSIQARKMYAYRQYLRTPRHLRRLFNQPESIVYAIRLSSRYYNYLILFFKQVMMCFFSGPQATLELQEM